MQKQHAAALKELRDELGSLKKAVAKSPNSEIEVDAQDGDKEARAEINAMRAQLKQLRALPVDVLALPAIDGQINELMAKIEAAVAKLHDKKPLDARMASKAAHLTRMEAIEAEAVRRMSELQEQQVALTKQIQEQKEGSSK